MKTTKDKEILRIPRGWIPAYTFLVQDLPLLPKKNVVEEIEVIRRYEGFIGLKPEESGTFLLFKTENDAKIARNLIRFKKEVGKNICKVFIPPRVIEA